MSKREKAKSTLGDLKQYVVGDEYQTWWFGLYSLTSLYSAFLLKHDAENRGKEDTRHVDTYGDVLMGATTNIAATSVGYKLFGWMFGGVNRWTNFDVENLYFPIRTGMLALATFTSPTTITKDALTVRKQYMKAARRVGKRVTSDVGEGVTSDVHGDSWDYGGDVESHEASKPPTVETTPGDVAEAVKNADHTAEGGERWKVGWLRNKAKELNRNPDVEGEDWTEDDIRLGATWSNEVMGDPSKKVSDSDTGGLFEEIGGVVEDELDDDVEVDW